MTAGSLASWLASTVFDGARAFGGVAPDLDLHCERVVRSALSFGLNPFLSAAEIEAIAWEGIRRFPKEAELYVRPMYWADDGFVAPDPDSTRFALVLTEMPLPKPTGFSACLSSYARPAAHTAPTDAKASCLYPNAARALTEAKAKGFDNAVMLDLLGNVAEFATANLFLVKDGVAITPVRQRHLLERDHAAADHQAVARRRHRSRGAGCEVSGGSRCGRDLQHRKLSPRSRP